MVVIFFFFLFDRNAVNAERQWRPRTAKLSGANRGRPERGERRKAMETRCVRPRFPLPHLDRNAVNAERQWRRRGRINGRIPRERTGTR